MDKATRDELIRRIGTLNEHSTAQWGKMNVYQMIKHCARWDEMAAGRIKYKQSLMGRVFGKMALNSMIKDDKPVKQSLPTVPDFVMTGNGDVAAERAKWIALMEGYANYNNEGFIHPFFGKMTKEQIGRLVYKHTDHHLRQFNS